MGNSNPEDSDKIRLISREILDYLIKNPRVSREKLNVLKGQIGKKHDYSRVIKNASILEVASQEEKKILIEVLKKRSTRTISGVSIIAIMTKPLPCPGTCVYCPGTDSQPGTKVAQSYTGREPAAMRSIHHNYDSYTQVESRIQDLEAIGHHGQKIELILMGGTILSADPSYQQEFVKGAYEGVLGMRVKSLDEAIKLAETSKRRVIGLTIETRPDYCKEKEIDLMLSYGVTRVEIGVQTVYDEIYTLIKRGHTIQDTTEAIRLSRDAGLKINAHIMPNLPGSNLEKDRKMFEELFSNSNYRPDMLKIYPCLVIKGTQLYDWWRNGKYIPYSDDELIDLIADYKKVIPSYARIQRIMRDIPADLIEAGCKKSNIRELVFERLQKSSSECNCIRCREVGIFNRTNTKTKINFNEIKLYRLDYDASGGNEIFLSLENKIDKYLVGFLRLRKPSQKAHRSELNDGKTLIVREIRVVGELVPINSKPELDSQIQHRGYGKMLLNEAEKIAKEEFNAYKLAVISGVGARDWFYNLGYKIDGPYVSKQLK